MRAQVDEAVHITSGTMNACVVSKFCRFDYVMSLFSSGIFSHLKGNRQSDIGRKLYPPQNNQFSMGE